MAGGIGSRFWPMSKTAVPKQFIDILGSGKSLLQHTFQRFERICPAENIYIVTNAIYFDLVKEQLPKIGDEQIVLEPARRNTAPCIAYANQRIKQKNPNAVIVVAPSDHHVEKEDVFVDIINACLATAAEKDNLFTIGIRPSYPNTGYGYIQYVDGNLFPDQKQMFTVKTFTEKPELAMAEQFIESGDFLWNAGIFIWSLKSIEKAFQTYLPEIHELFIKGENLYNTPAEKTFIESTYQQCKNISIDYGVMEKAQNVVVYAADFGWSDLGTWGALYNIVEKDEQGNSIVGKKVKTYNSSRCIVNMPKDKVVILQGLDDYIVVENDNTLLICKKEEEQQIRQYVTDVQIDFGDKYI